MANRAQPADAQNLADHCSKHAIPASEITHITQISSGNTFVVSRAQWRGECVALKQWHAAVVTQECRVLFAKRLTRELDLWCSLAHSNIAPVLGLALHIANLPALVVPAQHTVSELLRNHPSADVVFLMHGVAAGLSHLHAQKPPIVHGNLKGSSILVSRLGSALLSDIGIAAIPQPPNWAFRTVHDARWTAPELMDSSLRERGSFEGEHGLTPAARPPMTLESDVYSFGMLSYEMHTRARPFASTNSAADVMRSVVQGKRPPRPPIEKSPQMTDMMWEFVGLCWNQKCCKRPPIKAMLDWLCLIMSTYAGGRNEKG
ncbi:kinase-like domain-containing protein [Mycena vitilis]|nr:kinase-like domain-containing protein [Mycena vitilis]